MSIPDRSRCAPGGWRPAAWFALALTLVAFCGLGAPAQQPPAPVEDAPGRAEGAPAAEEPAPVAPKRPKSYESLPVDAKLRNAQGEIRTMLRNGVPSGKEQFFDDYYTKYALAEWTLPENFPKLPKLRQTLASHLTWTKGNSAHDRLTAVVLDFLGKMARNDALHPAPRYNAILAIGELNVRPPTMGKDAQPLPAALDVLMSALEDESLIDAVRFGALVGIVRHAQLGIADPGAQQRVADAMFKLATTRHVPGRSAAGHAWARTRAIELLGHFKSPGQDGAVAKALLAILDEPDASFQVRAAAAEALGQLNLVPGAGLEGAGAAQALGRLARDACRDEIKQCEEKKRLLNPHRLKSRLVCVRIGLTGVRDTKNVSEPTAGIAPLAADKKDRELLIKLWKPVESWIAKLDDKDLTAKPETQTNPAGGPMLPPMPVGGGAFGQGLGGGGFGEAGQPQETRAEAASKRILAEIKADLEKYEELLEPATE